MKVKKTIMALLGIIVILFLGIKAFGPAPSAISSEAVTIYWASPEDMREITLYYKDGQTDIPYVDMDTAMNLLLDVQELREDYGYKLTMEKDGEVVHLVRENGSRVSIDFASEEIEWDDYNLFISAGYTDHALDILDHSGFNDDGVPELFHRDSASFVRRGEGIGLRFEDFFIDLMYEDGMGYMPLQTYSDLFLAYTYYNLGYNGEAVFLIPAEDWTDLRPLYYAVEPKERSKELARFNYVEMCLALQFNYGLKDAHNIPSFGKLFELTGMEDALQNTDALVANTAMYDVINGFVDDLHSGFSAASPYAGDVEIVPNVRSISTDRLMGHAMNLISVAKKNYSDGIPPYQEIGNTAYVTFNKFDYDKENDYYDALAKNEPIADTVGIIMYAHSQITRENSPIENVVLDLSLNTGGDADSAIYTAAWFLGDCMLSVEDAITGALSSMSYKVDVNGDRIFDENDSISDLNRYCLVSPVSFSCGNLIPALFKSSNEVTLLGRRTGGGACAVQPLITADGTIWQISSRLRLSTVFNGSFYDIDQGIEPDFVIDKLENYYNREELTEYLNNLY